MKAFAAICRIICALGCLVPLVLTEFEVGVLLLLMIVGLFRTHEFSITTFAVLIFVGVGLGFTLSKVFRRSWANLVAAAVSSFWLIFGFYVLFDARAHPQKYSGGDGAESVIILIPFGLIGTICWLSWFCLGDRFPDVEAPVRVTPQ
jgi:hypothetical protein